MDKVKEAVDDISEDEAETMVKLKLKDSATSTLNMYLTAEKHKIIAYFENIWDKYGIDVRTMEKERDECAKQLDKYLEELGYDK